ncbi:NADH-quinone oxidoreductase subunit NuoK [Utexia brackfieldae]|uniref:NADH-quinone oxidoreductase subunit NuoK n=1 Tax=Utexia brackfieldae TaxID=3074108 RepID=UPI00370D5CA2
MIPLMHSLMLATALFVVGLLGVMIRRNLLFVLLSLMIMMNGAILALIAAGYHWQQFDGQIISILAISAALSEACVGLALLLQFYHRRKTLNIDSLSEMKG